MLIPVPTNQDQLPALHIVEIPGVNIRERSEVLQRTDGDDISGINLDVVPDAVIAFIHDEQDCGDVWCLGEGGGGVKDGCMDGDGGHERLIVVGGF